MSNALRELGMNGLIQKCFVVLLVPFWCASFQQERRSGRQ